MTAYREPTGASYRPPAEWQLVGITLECGGSIRYTFRHRALSIVANWPSMLSSPVVQDVVEAHPRDDFRIASWYTESEVTAPCSR